jgi:hypothetical protein
VREAESHGAFLGTLSEILYPTNIIQSPQNCKIVKCGGKHEKKKAQSQYDLNGRTSSVVNKKLRPKNKSF